MTVYDSRLLFFSFFFFFSATGYICTGDRVGPEPHVRVGEVNCNGLSEMCVRYVVFVRPFASGPGYMHVYSQGPSTKH